MSLMHVDFEVCPVNNTDPARCRTVRGALVDTGSEHAFIPPEIFDAITAPTGREVGELGDGSGFEYDIGPAAIRFRGLLRTTDIARSAPGQEPILGVLALEALGLKLDPRRGTLETRKRHR